MTNLNSSKIVLVTGSRTGIGKETGIVFARNGYKVIFSGRKPGDCSSTVKKLLAESFEVSEIPIDLSDIGSLEANVNRALEVWGGLDILINNAAIIDPITSLTRACAIGAIVSTREGANPRIGMNYLTDFLKKSVIP